MNVPDSLLHSLIHSFISPNSQSPWGVLPGMGAECDEEIITYAGLVHHTGHYEKVLRSKAEV